MIDLARALSGSGRSFSVTRLNYTSESIARAHAEMLAEIEAEQEAAKVQARKKAPERAFSRVPEAGCDQLLPVSTNPLPKTDTLAGEA